MIEDMTVRDSQDGTPGLSPRPAHSVTPSVPLPPPSRAARSRGSGFVLWHRAAVRCHTARWRQWKVKRTVGGRVGQRCLLCPNDSHINLFGHFECVIDLDAKVSRGALDLGMAEQQLNRPQVAGSAIDQRGLGSAQ
jgi:hypothetical protein